MLAEVKDPVRLLRRIAVTVAGRTKTLNRFGRWSLADAGCAEWRKSSYSSQGGKCVEVALNLPGLVSVRDSKASTRARRDK